MAKSEITKIFSERLEELTERKKDIDYKLSDKQQAEQMGIPYPTFTKYKNNTAECPISTVVKIARYYNVSTDYLLGLTQAKTTDSDLKSVCDYTGLSEEAIKTICGISKSPDRLYSNSINLILSSPKFAIFMLGVRQWLNDLDLFEESIVLFKEKLCEYGEEPPEDIMKLAAEISISDSRSSCVWGEAYDIMKLKDGLNYREYTLQNLLKQLLNELKKDGESNAHNNPPQE